MVLAAVVADDTADVCGLLFDLLTGADGIGTWDSLIVLPLFFFSQTNFVFRENCLWLWPTPLF